MQNRSMTTPKSASAAAPNSAITTAAAAIPPPCTAISASSKPSREIRSGNPQLKPMHAPTQGEGCVQKKIVKKVVKKIIKRRVSTQGNASVQEAVIGEQGNDLSGTYPVKNEPLRIEAPRVRHEPIIVEKAVPVTETKETTTNTVTKHRSQDSLVENRNVGPVGDKSVVLARGKGESSNYGVRFNEREEIGAVERKKQRKTEIFVGGLPNYADRHDIRKVFKKAVEVKLMMDYNTGRNKGYAFVRFATPDDAANAVVNSKVEIRGRLCDVAPVAGNDTLLLWNIDKNWKSEDVQALLEKSGISQIDKVTVKDERGFAFVEFETCQAAHYAMNKMQWIDVFGIFPRVQVKWAERLTEPEEHEISTVKTVYAEFLPLSWNREKVEEYFKRFGEIEYIVLAKELPSSRRLDYGFITYTTREAALTCVEAVRREISEDCCSKVKFAVSLAKPFPKPISKRTKYADAPPVRQQYSNKQHESTSQHMPPLPRTGNDAPNRHFLLPIKKRPISFVEEGPLYIQQHNQSYIQEGNPISGPRSYFNDLI